MRIGKVVLGSGEAGEEVEEADKDGGEHGGWRLGFMMAEEMMAVCFDD